MIRWVLVLGGAAGAAYWLTRSRNVRATGPAVSIPSLPNARRLPQGYVATAMIEPQHVPILRDLGVRATLSAARPSDATIAALRASGIEWVAVPMHSTFRHAGTLSEVAQRYRPEQIHVHCQHGADRTGNILAYYLVTEHGWSVPDALWAVVNPRETDTRGLGDVLASQGYNSRKTPSDPGVGAYAGRIGGMKARSEGYRNLITTNIAAMRGR